MSPEDARLAREEYARAESGDVPGWWRKVFRDDDGLDAGGLSTSYESDSLASDSHSDSRGPAAAAGPLPQMTLDVLRQIVYDSAFPALPESGDHRAKVKDLFENQLRSVNFRSRIARVDRQGWTLRRKRAFAEISLSQGGSTPGRVAELNAALCAHVDRLQATEKELHQRLSNERKALAAEEALLAHNGPMVLRVASARSRLRRTLGMVPVLTIPEGWSKFEGDGGVSPDGENSLSESEDGRFSDGESAEGDTPLAVASGESVPEPEDLLNSSRRSLPKRERRSTAAHREWNPAKAREKDIQMSLKLQGEKEKEARRRRQRQKLNVHVTAGPGRPLPPPPPPPPLIPEDAELAALGSLRGRVAVGIRTHRKRVLRLKQI